MTLTECMNNTQVIEQRMRDLRTVPVAEVDHRAAIHDSEDLKPEERASFDTGSMHIVRIR